MKLFEDFPSLLSVVLFFCIIAVPAAHSLWLYKKGRWYAFDPLNAFWAGVLIVYILQPLEFMGTFLGWHPEGRLIEKTFLWTVFGICFVIIGYELPTGQKWVRHVPRLPSRLVPRRLAAAGILLVLLGLAGYAYLIRSAHGLGNWLSQGRGATDWESVSGYVAQLEYALPVGLALLLFQVNMQPVRAFAKRTIWILAGLMWLWFVYLGTRSRTITWTATMFVAYYLPRRKNPRLWLAGSLFVGLFLLTSFQEHFRGYFTGLSFNFSQMDFVEVKTKVLPRFFTKTATDVSVSKEFNCVLTVMELVPEKVSYNYGYGYLEIFTRPIPRSLWPEKRYPAMESVYDVLDQGGLSSAWIATSHKPLLMGPVFTYVGHWYYVGGPIALVLAGLLTGGLFRMIRLMFDRCGDGQGDIILYGQVFLLGFLEAAGWPFSWVFQLPLTLIPVLVLFYWSAQREAAPEVPQVPGHESGDRPAKVRRKRKFQMIQTPPVEMDATAGPQESKTPVK